MPRFLNSLYGIVISESRDGLEIALPRGGTISAPLTEGVTLGDEVAFLMDTLNKHVVEVIPKNIADEKVMRGSNHFFGASMQRAPAEEEDNEYVECTGWEEHGDVFWCPDLG